MLHHEQHAFAAGTCGILLVRCLVVTDSSDLYAIRARGTRRQTELSREQVVRDALPTLKEASALPVCTNV
jgi:hypothetical protein